VNQVGMNRYRCEVFNFSRGTHVDLSKMWLSVAYLEGADFRDFVMSAFCRNADSTSEARVNVAVFTTVVLVRQYQWQPQSKAGISPAPLY